jgi:predicted cobalt transporter CbtA
VQVPQLLVRGMLTGIVAAVLALGFASLVAEPQIDQAVAYENLERMQRGEPPETPLVSRLVQRTAGLATGVVVYSVAFGGIFALAFAFAYGRFGRVSARATSALLALFGFVAVVIVPFIKYPANPPAVGNPATLDSRTLLYLAMVVLSVATAAFAAGVCRGVAPRFGTWNAAIASGLVFVVLIAGIMFVLPDVNEVPPGFPATVLWRFRLASLGTQLVLWAAFGLLFGALTERSLRVARQKVAEEQALPTYPAR